MTTHIFHAEPTAAGVVVEHVNGYVRILLLE